MAAEDRGENVRMRSMTRGLKDRNVAVLHQGADSIYDFAENLPSGWSRGNLVGFTDADALPAELAAVVTAAKAEAKRRDGSVIVEAELLSETGIRRLFEIHVTPDRDAHGSAGFILVVADITEIRERERALTSLMREVSHRSKNLLAIVQAVAMQTANNSDTTADFLQKFRGRLRALAGAQDLVTESDWRGSRFRELVRTQLSRLGQPVLDAVSVDGVNPVLGPNAALHIGLAIHELATNALLHGALAQGQDGDISLTAMLLPPPEDALVIEWREARSPGDTTRAPRFGTLVLERIVPLAVRGDATYTFEPSEVIYRLRAPGDQLAL